MYFVAPPLWMLFLIVNFSLWKLALSYTIVSYKSMYIHVVLLKQNYT